MHSKLDQAAAISMQRSRRLEPILMCCRVKEWGVIVIISVLQIVMGDRKSVNAAGGREWTAKRVLQTFPLLKKPSNPAQSLNSITQGRSIDTTPGDRFILTASNTRFQSRHSTSFMPLEPSAKSVRCQRDSDSCIPWRSCCRSSPSA